MKQRYRIYTRPDQRESRYSSGSWLLTSFLAIYGCVFSPYCRIEDAATGKTLFLDVDAEPDRRTCA